MLASKARLHRVDAALSCWNEVACAATMPAGLRPPVEAPTLSRPALKALQVILVGEIGEQEEAWERRP